MTCSACGFQIPDDLKFCGECGTSLAADDQSPATSVPLPGAIGGPIDLSGRAVALAGSLGRIRRHIVLLALGSVLAACSTAGVRDRGPYGGPYDYDPYGRRRVDPGALERHQDRERERLDRQQEGGREQILREQRRERRQRKKAGEWDPTDKREQAKERRQQQRRFDHQDHELREHQEDERDLYE